MRGRMKLLNNRIKLYLILNLLFISIFSIILVIATNLIFHGSKIQSKKEMIAVIAEIEKKEGAHLLDKVDYESEESVAKAFEQIEKKGYIADKNFFDKSILKNLFIFLIGFVLFAMIVFENFYYFRMQRKNFFSQLDIYMQSIIDENFDVKLSDDTEDVVSKINMRLNKLGTYLKKRQYKSEEDLSQLKSSLADISHQIKTPLTSLSMNNEILLESENLNEEQIQFLKITQSQISRLRWLTDSLLKISKLESHTVKFNPRKIFAWELTEGFEDVLINQLKKQNINLVIKGNMDTLLNVDYDWTREALLNIVKNASEHAYKNSNIEIVFVDNPSFQGVEILNEGDPIDINELPKIFDRFYKTSNNKNPESIGIGLNLSKKIIESQGGIISVSNEVGKIKFSVLFLKI